jgi:hypothetical protein
MGDLKGEKSGAISPFIPSIGFAERRIRTMKPFSASPRMAGQVAD